VQIKLIGLPRVFQHGMEFADGTFRLPLFMTKFFFWIFILTVLARPVGAQLLPTDSGLVSHAAVDSPFLFLTCSVANQNAVELSWEVVAAERLDYFAVERSRDGSHYETIEVLKVTDTATLYQLNDNPAPGPPVYYRIRYNWSAGTFTYSRVAQVLIWSDPDFRFYPNPVDKLLIIRTSHPIDVQLVDSRGDVRLHEAVSPGLRVLNCSSLERGQYVLKVIDKQGNSVESAPLLKD
jgi:hypothetical protein